MFLTIGEKTDVHTNLATLFFFTEHQNKVRKSVLLSNSLSPQRGLQGPTHGEGQLCLVLVGIKSIMPEEVNFSSLSCILFAPINFGPCFLCSPFTFVVACGSSVGATVRKAGETPS